MRSLEPLPRARSTPSRGRRRRRRASIASDARSPQAYISSSSARSRSAAGLGAARRGEQPRDLAAAQHLRQLLALARRAQVGGRVVVEHRPRGAGGGRTSAGTRPCAAASRARPAAAPRRPRRARDRNAGELAVLGGERRRCRGGQERAELQQVRAVGLERVARQPALELEVGEEVEHVVLERPRLRGGVDGHGAEFAVPADAASPVQRRVRAAGAVAAAGDGVGAATGRSADGERGAHGLETSPGIRQPKRVACGPSQRPRRSRRRIACGSCRRTAGAERPSAP